MIEEGTRRERGGGLAPVSDVEAEECGVSHIGSGGH